MPVNVTASGLKLRSNCAPTAPDAPLNVAGTTTTAPGSAAAWPIRNSAAGAATLAAIIKARPASRQIPCDCPAARRSADIPVRLGPPIANGRTGMSALLWRLLILADCEQFGQFQYIVAFMEANLSESRR